MDLNLFLLNFAATIILNVLPIVLLRLFLFKNKTVSKKLSVTIVVIWAIIVLIIANIISYYTGGSATGKAEVLWGFVNYYILTHKSKKDLIHVQNNSIQADNNDLNSKPQE